jgi:hypothetical protein
LYHQTVWSKKALDPETFTKRYGELLQDARNQGRVMNDVTRRELLEAALVNVIENKDNRHQVAQAIFEAVSNFQLAQKDEMPSTVRNKFRMDEERRRQGIEAKRWVIPARLEF